MNFSEALEIIQADGCITNDDWNDRERYVSVLDPSQFECAFINSPALYMHDGKGNYRIWSPSQNDLFSTTWRKL